LEKINFALTKISIAEEKFLDKLYQTVRLRKRKKERERERESADRKLNPIFRSWARNTAASPDKLNPRPRIRNSSPENTFWEEKKRASGIARMAAGEFLAT